jgi:uncharacterized membrane protein YqjE
MPIAVTLALLLFWVVIAYRQYQRGDVVLAAVFLVVGVVLTVYRIRQAQSRAAAQGLTASTGQDSNPRDPIGK